MASYLAGNLRRDTVTLMLSKAEAEALRDLALFSEPSINDGLPMNGSTMAAARRAIDGFTFTRLVSAADFTEEGAVMRHCIAGYARDAKAGRETAFRIEGPERASVSFATSGHVEIRGRLNSKVTEPCRRAAMKAWATFKAEPGTPR